MGIDLNNDWDHRSEEDINADHLKTMLQIAGVSVKRTEPFGNADCPCGSGNRYDMCCSKNKLV